MTRSGLVHNYWGVFLSLVITGFPFTFLLVLSYVTGIDPSLEQAACDARGAGAGAVPAHPVAAAGAGARSSPSACRSCRRSRCFPRRCCWGRRPGDTRVISIAAYQAAFEDYDYSMASAIAMIMAFVQVLIVVLLLAGQGLGSIAGPAGGGKG